MPSNYLQGTDATSYGVGSATAAQIQQASIIIDGYLQRAEGLIYTNDGNGNPAYMTALVPKATLTASGSITAGASVAIAVTGPLLNVTVGTPLLLDHANAGLVEACVVTAVTGNTITLGTVVFNHSTGCTLDLGLFIPEQKMLPKSRPMVNLKSCPVARIIAGRGRYGYGRRGDQTDYSNNDFNLLAALQKFGGPPIWETFDVTKVDCDPTTGLLWVPAGIMMAYYTDIQVYYVSGWPLAALPAEIKQACANIVNAIINQPFAGNIKSQSAGDTNYQRFSATYLDADTMALLAPYKARSFL